MASRRPPCWARSKTLSAPGDGAVSNDRDPRPVGGRRADVRTARHAAPRRSRVTAAERPVPGFRAVHCRATAEAPDGAPGEGSELSPAYPASPARRLAALHEPPDPRVEPVPPPARAQPGQLVSLGRRGVRP